MWGLMMSVLSPGLCDSWQKISADSQVGSFHPPPWIPLSQAFFLLASACAAPLPLLSSLCQHNNKSVSGFPGSGPILRDEVCIGTIYYKDKWHLTSARGLLYTYAAPARQTLFFMLKKFVLRENALFSTFINATHKKHNKFSDWLFIMKYAVV